MRFALFLGGDGFPTLVVEADQAQAVLAEAAPLPDGWVTVGPNNIIGIGWTYAGGQFIPPPAPVEEPVA